MMNAAKELLTFIENSPSMFHSIETIKGMLEEAGFTYLPERTRWDVKQGGTYYTIRNHSSIIAFRVGKELGDYHFQMCASHSDSPTYKIKSVPELNGPGEYLRLDVEAYGGMIDNTWFDRPLTVAGRVLVKDGQGVSARLLYIDKDLLIIPNVAIHFNREVNNGYKYNRQVDLCPLFSAGELKKGAFDAMIAKELGVAAEDILGKDLFLVNRQPGTIWGYADEFISSPKLDDLQCAYVSLKAFLEAKNERDVSVYCCFDNEEVGSNTKQGAMSTFLQDVLHRINTGMGRTEEEYLTALASSFMVSADNAHAIHPNQPDKADPTSRPYLNQGIVIKYSANQKYCTDAVSAAVFKTICEKAEVPYQVFLNRSDILGGSTLGNISGTQVALNTVDIGLPQLAMHSSYETAGSRDTAYLLEAAKVLFSGSFAGKGDGSYKIG